MRVKHYPIDQSINKFIQAHYASSVNAKLVEFINCILIRNALPIICLKVLQELRHKFIFLGIELPLLKLKAGIWIFMVYYFFSGRGFKNGLNCISYFLNRSLKSLVTPLIAGLLESSLKLRWTFDEFFRRTNDIMNKITIKVFDCSTGINNKLYVDKSDR